MGAGAETPLPGLPTSQSIASGSREPGYFHPADGGHRP